jgi:hypothetical protein
MTNLEVQRQAARFAAHHAARADYLDPDDAWHLWSAEHGVTSPAARHVFEGTYQARMNKLTRH